MVRRASFLSVTYLALLSVASIGTTARAQEVIVLAGIDEIVSWLEAEDWWGEENRGEHLTVPHAMLTGVNPAWRDAAQELPVAEKKEIFYRFMLPLIVHANHMVDEGRTELMRMQEMVVAGESLPDDDMEALRRAALMLRITSLDEAAELTQSDDELAAVIEEALYKLDVIPAGLALGQAAYESGYGTARFTIEGNALFGQWTYGGKGLVPEQQRDELGDHRIAAFDWPFDSVRGYFINLMSHPAYEDFRRIRAQLRANGEPMSSLAMADGLTSYSERGQEYVDTLKGMIRTNNLDIADDAVFRDEPIRFVVGAESEEAAELLRDEIEVLRESGDLALIIERMRLE
jgi:uncharacterized FlgJ-related protein